MIFNCQPTVKRSGEKAIRKGDSRFTSWVTKAFPIRNAAIVMERTLRRSLDEIHSRRRSLRRVQVFLKAFHRLSSMSKRRLAVGRTIRENRLRLGEINESQLSRPCTCWCRRQSTSSSTTRRKIFCLFTLAGN